MTKTKPPQTDFRLQKTRHRHCEKKIQCKFSSDIVTRHQFSHVSPMHNGFIINKVFLQGHTFLLCLCCVHFCTHIQWKLIKVSSTLGKTKIISYRQWSN